MSVRAMYLSAAAVVVLVLLLALPRAQGQQSGAGGGGQGQATVEGPPGTPQGPTVVVPGTSPTVNVDRPGTVAVQTQEVPSPAAPPHYVEGAIWALLASQLYEYLKKCAWFKLLPPDISTRAQAQIGFVMAVLTVAGIHFAVNGSLLDDGGATVTISGLSWSAFKDIAYQWGVQQGIYLKVVKGS